MTMLQQEGEKATGPRRTSMSSSWVILFGRLRMMQLVRFSIPRLMRSNLIRLLSGIGLYPFHQFYSFRADEKRLTRL